MTEITEDYPFVDFSEVDSEEDLMWEQKEDVPDDGASVACATRAVKLLEWLQASGVALLTSRERISLCMPPVF